MWWLRRRKPAGHRAGAPPFIFSGGVIFVREMRVFYWWRESVIWNDFYKAETLLYLFYLSGFLMCASLGCSHAPHFYTCFRRLHLSCFIHFSVTFFGKCYGSREQEVTFSVNVTSQSKSKKTIKGIRIKESWTSIGKLTVNECSCCLLKC